MRRMNAEWERQSAVLMAFPHIFSDWASQIEEARENFIAIIKQIALFEDVMVCVHPEDKTGKEILEKLPRVKIFEVKTNDTWARDFGPISVTENSEMKLLDFGFNGWGLKFAANDDNQVNTHLSLKNAWKYKLEKMPIILEGGSIDTDGEGRILTNTQCLLEANRNPHLSQEKIEEILKSSLGAKEVLWLHSGYLKGDDTDSHIDTLVRFLDKNTIAYVKCEDKNDEHYIELEKMEKELQKLRTQEGKAYDLLPLPLPSAIYEENQRLPATYANFLFINNALLVPVYGDKKDNEALAILQNKLKDRKVIGIDCSTLIKQHGSLHCITMQIY